MGTTTGSSDTPVRRSTLWSHNTSYPGVARVHSEVGKKADVIQRSGQRELKASLSSIQSLHQKELRTLQQHRKSLESSMLAYSEKMRKISSGRLRLAQASKPSGEEKGEEGGSFNRLLASSVSSDTKSGVSMENSLTVPVSSTHTTGKSRPASFHSVDDLNSTQTVTTLSRGSDQTSQPVASRRRRTGTLLEQPDVSALKLSIEKNTSRVGRSSSSDEIPPSSVSEDSASPPLAIRPFPESKPSSSGLSEDKSRVQIILDEDFDRISGASSRTSQSSTKKLMTKTKDNYWSYRKKSSPRLSLPLLQSQAAKKKSSTSSEPPRPSPRHRPIHGHRVTPRRSNKTYHTSFRYSLAVEDAMQSLEHTAVSTAVTRRTTRAVSLSLPALDLLDLRAERQRLQEETHRSDREVMYSDPSPFSTATQQQDHPDTDAAEGDWDHNGTHGSSRNEDPEHGRDDVDDDSANDEDSDRDVVEGVQVLALSRERSLSAPDVLHHHEEVLEGRVQESSEDRMPGQDLASDGSSSVQNSASKDRRHPSAAFVLFPPDPLHTQATEE